MIRRRACRSRISGNGATTTSLRVRGGFASDAEALSPERGGTPYRDGAICPGAGEQGTPGFVLAGVEEGFSRLALYRRFPFLGVATEPRVYLLARSDGQKRSPCVATTKS